MQLKELAGAGGGALFRWQNRSRKENIAKLRTSSHPGDACARAEAERETVRWIEPIAAMRLNVGRASKASVQRRSHLTGAGREFVAGETS